MKDKKKKKDIVIDPYFILGITRALGGPIDNPNETDVSDMLPDFELERVNVNKQTAKGAVTGAIEGASTGASIGSMIPGVGTVIGAGVGALVGGVGEGIKSRNQAKDIQEMNMEMFKDMSDPIETFALGGELNSDPPITNSIYYKYKQRPNAIYRNTNNIWEIDLNNSGTFLPLNDPTGERVKEIMTHGELINTNNFSSQRDSNANIKALGGPIKGGNTNHPLAPTNTGGDPNVSDPNARGYRDPLDGSNELDQEQAAWALLKNKYGDINFFAQKDNEFRQKQESKSPEELSRISAEGDLYESSFNPDNLSSGSEMNWLQSALKASSINRATRQNDLGYQKIKANAFVNKEGQETASFANGGPLNVDNIEGPTHEEGGIPMAGAEVEGGESKVGNYIFSDRLAPEGSKRTFSQRAKAIELKYKERDNDGPAQRSKAKELESLMAENEMARKQEEMKQAQLEVMLQADAYAYGGYLKKCANGGTIEVDPKMSGMFKSLARKRGMKMEDYTTKIYALGGPIDEEGDPPYLQTMLDANGEPTIDPSMDPRFDYMEQQLTLPSNNDLGSTIIETPDSSILSNKPGNPNTGDFKFGNEEAALLLSNMPALDNYIESFNRDKTRFGRVSPNTISLDTQRDKIESEYAKARGIARENIRGNATSAGQALSNMATANAALTGSLSDDLGESFFNEETANTQIRNQANQLNTEIGNQEVIANEQNEDLRRSLKNRALAEVAMNSQMYLKDKKLTAENIRQNDRLMQLINSAFPNYKFDSDNGQFAIKFLSQMQEAQNLLP